MKQERHYHGVLSAKLVIAQLNGYEEFAPRWA